MEPGFRGGRCHSEDIHKWAGRRFPAAMRRGCWLIQKETEFPISYRVFSGPKGSGEIAPLAKEQMLFKELGSLDEALSWAQHLDRTGRLPMLIEGDDGTRMNRREIGEALGARKGEQVGGA